MVTPGTRDSDQVATAVTAQKATAEGTHGALRALFPLAPEPAPRTWIRRGMSAAAQIAAVGIASIAMLLRIPGRPAWRTIFGDDYFWFLAQAIQRPWHWGQYGGYVEVLPRFIAQVVSYLPLTDAALAFALAGVVVAACGALVIFHASAGHIESVKLRALLAVALVLLPIAPMELIASGVEAPWYLLPVLFWAMLWRPRTRPAMAVAAAIGFLTMASNILAVLLAPLLVARLYVLRRPREHAVSAGWLAGCLVQAAYVIPLGLNSQSRLDHSLTPLRQSLAFYGHVVLAAIARLAHVVVATVVRRSKRGRRDRGRRTRRQLRPDPRHPAGGTAIRGDRRCSRLHLLGGKHQHQPGTGHRSDASHGCARHPVRAHG